MSLADFERALDRLSGIDAWIRQHGRSTCGCTAAPECFQAPENCRLTYNPRTNQMYVHVLSWPFRHLHLSGFASRVAYAQRLNDASEVRFERDRLAHIGATDQPKETLALELPVQMPDVSVPVIELFMEAEN